MEEELDSFSLDDPEPDMTEIELPEPEPPSALDQMSEYMGEHNYGQEDFETYSKDPEWQALNNELQLEDGLEPTEYDAPEEPSALDQMAEYMSEHDYGREDFETYSKDPEWQALNNELQAEDGLEPTEYDAPAPAPEPELSPEPEAESVRGINAGRLSRKALSATANAHASCWKILRRTAAVSASFLKSDPAGTAPGSRPRKHKWFMR